MKCVFCTEHRKHATNNKTTHLDRHLHEQKQILGWSHKQKNPFQRLILSVKTTAITQS